MLRRSIPVAVAALVLFVPSAEAQPHRGVPVAGPTPSGARLFVHDSDDSLCGSVRRPGQRYRSESCGSEFQRLRAPILGSDDFGRDGLAFVWGAVAPEVSAVEVVFTDGRRVGADTTDGAAYRGRHAGRLRFFLVETRDRRGSEPFYVRLLDQAGRLLSAEEVSPDGGGSPQGRVLVGRGRLGAERWRLNAFRRLRLLPLPGEEERVVGESCVDFGYRGAGRFRGPTFTTEACADPDGVFGPWSLSLDTACRAIGLSAIGLAPRAARKLVAVLGDGRRVRVPLRELPARFGDQRAFALVLGPTTALRRVIALENGRRRVLAGGIAPGIKNCPNATSGFFGFPDLDLFDEPRFGPGGPALQVRDDGVLLCARISLPGPLDCLRPPLEAGDSRILWHSTNAGTFAAGVLPPEVASVVLEWEGGERDVVPTSAEGPYTGRYRGLVRFFTVSLAGRRSLRRVVLLDAGGGRLLQTRVFQPPVFDPAPVALLRGSGGWRVGAGVVRLAGRRFPCVELSRGAFRRDPLSCLGSAPAVAVGCRPRSMRFYGRLRDGVRTARVETDSGVFGARTARLPSRLGVRGRVFLIELPANARPRWFVLEGRKERRERIRLPAAQSQCGYGTSLS